MANGNTDTSLALGASSALQQDLSSAISFAPQMQQPKMPVMYQPPPIQNLIQQNPPGRGSFATTGERKRYDRQRIFSGIAEMVKSGTSYIQQKKQRALEMDIERLISAWQGMQEAQTAGNKEAYQKNAEIINDITKDPKKSKLIAKAFNIDLLGGGKNKLENQALFNAYKTFAQKQQKGENPLNPNAQRILGQMPQRQQIDPRLALRAQLIQAKILPEANKVLESLQKSKEAVQKSKDYQARTTAIADAAKLIAESKKYGVDAQVASAIERDMSLQDRAQLTLQGIKYRADSMFQAIKLRVDAINKLTDVKGASELIKSVHQNATEIQNKIKTDQDLIEKLSKDIESNPGWFDFKKGGMPSAQIKDLQLQMMKAQQDLEIQSKAWQNVQSQIKYMDASGMLKGAVGALSNIQTPDTGSDTAPIDTEKDTTPINTGGDINFNFSEEATPQ